MGAQRLILNLLVIALVVASVARAPSAVLVVLGAAAIAVSWFAARPSPGAKPVAFVTGLVADLHDAGADLQNVLAGIVADEGGKVAASNGNMLALFRGRGHAAAAVHAAQRMMSNVDALRRRLERDVQITIGVDSAAESDAGTAAAAVEKLTRDRRVPVLIGAATVAKLGSAAVAVAAIDDAERFFSFVPVQQNLPGF